MQSFWGRQGQVFKDLKWYLEQHGDDLDGGGNQGKGKVKVKRKAAGSVSEGNVKKREKKKVHSDEESPGSSS
jgi:hypothetical protein